MNKFTHQSVSMTAIPLAAPLVSIRDSTPHCINFVQDAHSYVHQYLEKKIELITVRRFTRQSTQINSRFTLNTRKTHIMASITFVRRIEPVAQTRFVFYTHSLTATRIPVTAVKAFNCYMHYNITIDRYFIRYIRYLCVRCTSNGR